ncbi:MULTISPECIES: hypothetical protein [unclassified Bradyrhizobium]|uniref:hypothetical protein n=1 Tax=unclassified Bradyrhizobium TaxID=2631580 RepID=UPI00143D4D32|nr:MULTISPECIES: hypothetical protein [unclassified Bradyrhizobium]
MNKEILTAIVVVVFLALAWSIETAIDRWRPATPDLQRCLALVAAAIAVGAAAIWFL